MDCTHLLQPTALFDRLRKLATAMQLPTYAVGGCVRDALLGRSSKDIDIVCVGNSIALAKAFARQGRSRTRVIIFKRFGTAMIRWKGYKVEFVNARKESYTPSSRNPTVTQGNLKDDVMRRDFTINALLISLNEADYGMLIDWCNGTQDLKQRVLCTPEDPIRTMSDDPLRMLRAARFAAQLGFHIAPATQQAIRQEADRISILPKERIIIELNKILTSPSPAEGLLQLDRMGLLQRILPEMERLKGKEVINGQSHKDNFLHTLQVMRNLARALKGKNHPNHLWLLWTAVLHDIAKPATKAFQPGIGFTFHGHEHLGAKMVPNIFRRLGLPMKAARHVQKRVGMHGRHVPLTAPEASESALRRYMHEAGDLIDELLLFARADITSENSKRRDQLLKNIDTLASRIHDVEEKDRIRNFALPIDGEEIMATFQLKPSRPVGAIRGAIKEAILSGTIPNTHEAAHAYMLQYAQTLGLRPA